MPGPDASSPEGFQPHCMLLHPASAASMFLSFIARARLLVVRLALHGGGVDVVCDDLVDGDVSMMLRRIRSNQAIKEE